MEQRESGGRFGIAIIWALALVGSLVVVGLAYGGQGEWFGESGALGPYRALAVVFGASVLGAPVSTTHVVSSAIMGIGSAEHAKSVRWAKAQEIVSTWLITIPGAGLVGVLAYLIASIFVR